MSAGTARIIAACFALASFAVALMAGLAADNAAAQILLRAVLAMIVCYPVGLIAGFILDVVIGHHMRAQMAASSAEAALQSGSADGVSAAPQGAEPSGPSATEEPLMV